MKARISISNRLLGGFGTLLFLIVINGIVILSNINSNIDLVKESKEVYYRGHNYMTSLLSICNQSWAFTRDAVFIPEEQSFRDQLNKIQNSEFLAIKEDIRNKTNHWNAGLKKDLENILITISDTFFITQQQILIEISNPETAQNHDKINQLKAAVSPSGSGTIKYQEVIDKIENFDRVFLKKNEQIDKEIFNQYNAFKNIILISVFLIVVFLIIIGVTTIQGITIPITNITRHLGLMTKGILPDVKLKESNDEFGDMAHQMNKYIENMRTTADFATAIGNGDYNKEFAPMGKEDAIGNALLNMRKNLLDANEEYKKRAQADDIRNWSAKGLAEFADILRQNSNNMDELARSVMINLVDYLQVNQGAIYILNQDNEAKPYFQMKSAIAYGREKYMKRNFEMQEGLVGRCAFEKLHVYLKEIPEDYIRITSGLGTAEASFLLLVPLMVNDVVLGVIEIASFNEIPEHQINFVKALGENIASTISNVRINEKTKVLLEESRLRGDELSAQEEELRQNMEELQATQEEAQRREQEMIDSIEAINNTLGNIELDRMGNIISVNEHFLSLIRMDANSLIGRSFREMFIGSSDVENQFIELWSSLQVGESGSLITNFITPDGELWFKHTFSPFRRKTGEFSKAVDLILNITEQKVLERELHSLKTKF